MPGAAGRSAGQSRGRSASRPSARPSRPGPASPRRTTAPRRSCRCCAATRKYEPRIRAAYERVPGEARGPDRPPAGQSRVGSRSGTGCCSSWAARWATCGDPGSVDTLLASLAPELNEARHGRPDPSEPNIHFLQLEYTPCWRATAAWALGRIGDRRACRPLLDVVRRSEQRHRRAARRRRSARRTGRSRAPGVDAADRPGLSRILHAASLAAGLRIARNRPVNGSARVKRRGASDGWKRSPAFRKSRASETLTYF